VSAHAFEDAKMGIEAKATRVSRNTEKLTLVQCCNNSEAAILVRVGLRKNKAYKIRPHEVSVSEMRNFLDSSVVSPHVTQNICYW